MSEVLKKAALAKTAQKELNITDGETRQNILLTMAKSLITNQQKILKANALDISRGKKNKMSEALIDRLTLNEKRIQDMADGLKTAATLPDPLNKILWETTRPNGLKIQKISVTMGVIGMIYEARPNVTADAAGLCLKAGSAVILRGGSDAQSSNKAIITVLKAAVKSAGMNPNVIQLIESTDRKLVTEMMTLNKYLDVLIPRGGAGLIKNVIENATVPVIETGIGNCHVYIDDFADLDKALNIAFNSKVQRPSVCNAAETLLIHQTIAKEFLPKILNKYFAAGVKIHGCPLTQKYDKRILKATAADYYQEYLALEIAIKVVASLEEAIAHIEKYGSKHTETIVSENSKSIAKFQKEIDAAAVLVNASTRFTDGGEFGFGCEIGISTQKLQARGPMGLSEICSYKYLVTGNGQIRN